MIHLCTVKTGKGKWVITCSDCSKYQEYQEPCMRGALEMLQELDREMMEIAGIENTNRRY